MLIFRRIRWRFSSSTSSAATRLFVAGVLELQYLRRLVVMWSATATACTMRPGSTTMLLIIDLHLGHEPIYYYSTIQDDVRSTCKASQTKIDLVCITYRLGVVGDLAACHVFTASHLHDYSKRDELSPTKPDDSSTKRADWRSIITIIFVLQVTKEAT